MKVTAVSLRWGTDCLSSGNNKNKIKWIIEGNEVIIQRSIVLKKTCSWKIYAEFHTGETILSLSAGLLLARAMYNQPVFIPSQLFLPELLICFFISI